MPPDTVLVDACQCRKASGLRTYDAHVRGVRVRVWAPTRRRFGFLAVLVKHLVRTVVGLRVLAGESLPLTPVHGAARQHDDFARGGREPELDEGQHSQWAVPWGARGASLPPASSGSAGAPYRPCARTYAAPATGRQGARSHQDRRCPGAVGALTRRCRSSKGRPRSRPKPDKPTETGSLSG
jgi:hypothetical protein